MSRAGVKLPGQVLVKLVACLLALALFFWVLVLPRKQEIAGLEEDVVRTKAVIERQNKLFPLYVSLSSELKKTDVSAFPESQGQPLPLERVSDLSGLLSDQARAYGVQCLSVTPAPDSLDPRANTLDAQCEFLGDLDDLRRLMISMGGLEYLRGARAMRFENQGGKTLCSMTVLVALAGSGRVAAKSGKVR